jgi:hypothetical protein
VGTKVSAIVERRVSEHPAEIRDDARALSKAIADQIDLLNAGKPNEPEDLARHNDFITFLREIAERVDALAGSLDRAIAAESPSLRMSYLAKSKEIMGGLGTFVAEGFEEHRNVIKGCAVLVPALGISVAVLHCLLGIDANFAAGIVAGIMGVKSVGDSKK